MTGGASAAGFEWRLRQFMGEAAELNLAAGGERYAALGELTRNDTIKHVYSTVHRFKNINRRTDAH